MTVKQGLLARGVAFVRGALAVVAFVEAYGRSVVAVVVGADADVDGLWTGVRMGGWSIGFVLLMLGLGRFGAAATHVEADGPRG